MTRRYSELEQLPTYEERYDYLVLTGNVGSPTFGSERWINQDFYRSRQWKMIRNHVIARDMGCDLGIEGYEIHHRLMIHHMNPISAKEIVHGEADILDPEFLITTTHVTHNSIHYGEPGKAPRTFVERRPGDTKLW